jgi:carotenoid 1,2-hydratase
MTERGRGSLRRSADTLAIGPSHLRWTGSALEIEVVETTFPIPSAIRGRIRVHPRALVAEGFDLDPNGRHRWCPIATRADIEVELFRPSLAWRGEAYLDSNFGDEPLEATFHHWQWSRAHLSSGERVFYEGGRRDGTGFALGLAFDRHGTPTAIPFPPAAQLRNTLWRMPRTTRADGATIRRTWEDTPFYSRTALDVSLEGETVPAVHESLSLDRLRNPIVRSMLPWRMPRFALP